MNTIQATGPGGAAAVAAVPLGTTSGASLAGDIHDDNDRASQVHGLLMVVVSLAVAPIDMIAAGALRRWPAVHMLTSFAYVAGVMAAFGLSIKISAEYLSVRPTALPTINALPSARQLPGERVSRSGAMLTRGSRRRKSSTRHTRHLAS